jgi:hypothetical protein
MSFDAVKRLYAKKNKVYEPYAGVKLWCMGPYAGVDYYNSPNLIVNSVVSQPAPQQRERGGVGKTFPVG